MEKTEKTETNTERIVNDKTDHVAIHNFAMVDLLPVSNQMDLLKENLLSLRESGNISVRETQKILTTLAKTIHAVENFKTYLTETAYNQEHAVEIHEEKRALRSLIKDATPSEMSEFRAFLKEKKLLSGKTEQTSE